MNILYYSVHQILEFDEIILLRQSGHFVFPLGAFFDHTPAQPFRPAPALGEQMELFRRKFDEMHCSYRYGASAEDISISPDFVSLFDVCIVMHDFGFIKKHLFNKCSIPVIWRSIGVSTEYHEPDANWFADHNGVIVRYSPREAACNKYAGHGAIIRFAKDPSIYLPWLGLEKHALLFSHDLKIRFPEEAAFIYDVIRDISFVLGGKGNEGLAGSVGVIEYVEQIRRLSRARLYFYAAGSFIPYTLNFIEACFSGIPIVALDCRSIYRAEMCKFAEIPSLIERYGCGILVQSVAQARDAIEHIMDDCDAANQIGDKGRRMAINLFSYDVIAPQWEAIFKIVKSGRGILL